MSTSWVKLARQRHESVAHGDDSLLPLCHRTHPYYLAYLLRLDYVFGKQCRDDSNHSPTLVHSRRTDDPHEAEVASAIDEGVLLLGDAAAEDGGGLDDFLVVRHRRAAEDCYVHCVVSVFIAVHEDGSR